MLKKLKSVKATIDERNTEQKCFMYCLLAKSFSQNIDYDQKILDEKSFIYVENKYNFDGNIFLYFQDI